MRLAASASLLSAHDTSKENKTHKQRANLSRPDDIQFQRIRPLLNFVFFNKDGKNYAYRERIAKVLVIWILLVSFLALALLVLESQMKYCQILGKSFSTTKMPFRPQECIFVIFHYPIWSGITIVLIEFISNSISMECGNVTLHWTT